MPNMVYNIHFIILGNKFQDLIIYLMFYAFDGIDKFGKKSLNNLNQEVDKRKL